MNYQIWTVGEHKTQLSELDCFSRLDSINYFKNVSVWFPIFSHHTTQVYSTFKPPKHSSMCSWGKSHLSKGEIFPLWEKLPLRRGKCSQGAGNL